METIAPETCRAGRGLVGWSQEELARHAQVGLSTVRNFETRAVSARTGEPIRPTRVNLAALRAALEAAGVVFIPENGGGPGVRLARREGSEP